MANVHSTLTGLFAAIADAIRSKKGTTEAITADNFPSEIAAIQTGVDTSDATATAANIQRGYTAYSKGKKVVGTGAIASNVHITGWNYSGQPVRIILTWNDVIEVEPDMLFDFSILKGSAFLIETSKECVSLLEHSSANYLADTKDGEKFVYYIAISTNSIDEIQIDILYG